MDMFPHAQRVHFAVIESTHVYAVHNGLSLPDGTVITADYQTGGRGRSGRSWSAPPRSGLLLSALLSSQLKSNAPNMLIHVTALSVADFLRNLGMDPALKWPNDLIVSGKKIAGVLAETSLRGKHVDFAVLSAGINLNQGSTELAGIDVPATSAFAEIGHTFDPAAMLNDFLDLLEKNLLSFFTSGPAPIMQRWKSFECLTGKRVSLDTGREVIDGIVTGYGDDGSIILNDGTVELGRFQAGDIVNASAKCGNR